MSSNPTNHVFMSYSRKDEVVMQQIVAFLRNEGIRVWVDNENLIPGTPIWEVNIEKAILDSVALIVLCSPDSKRSEWVRREITYAEQYGKFIIPALVSGDRTEAVTISLINYQHLDLRSNVDVGLKQLRDLLIKRQEEEDLRKVKHKRTSQTDLKKYIDHLQEVLRSLPSTPSLPIMTFLEIYSKNDYDDETKLRAIIIDYRKRLIEAIEFMQARKASVPPSLETAIRIIDMDILGFTHWVGR